jgi:hypothetical protein
MQHKFKTSNLPMQNQYKNLQSISHQIILTHGYKYMLQEHDKVLHIFVWTWQIYSSSEKLISKGVKPLIHQSKPKTYTKVVPF